MINLSKVIATVFGVGYIKKGGGTAAAVVYCLLWFFIPGFSTWLQLLLLFFVIALGVWTSSVLEKIWGKDSGKIVIDEVAGMMIALLFVPVAIEYIISALVLFRFFDIVKPLGIKKMEKLPKGWGVMSDDILSGIYALIILQTVIALKLF